MLRKDKVLLDFSSKRRATKVYNPDKLIEQDKLNYIFKVINTAPTSIGLEHWNVLSFRDKNVKQEVSMHVNEENRKKFIDCSDALVFYTKKDSWFNSDNPEFVKKIKRLIDATDATFNTKTSEDDLRRRTIAIANSDPANNERNLGEWSKRQAYIACGYAMLAAAEQDINSTPVEGFKKSIDEYLVSKNYINSDESVAVIILLGYIDGIQIPFIGKEQLREKIENKFRVI